MTLCMVEGVQQTLTQNCYELLTYSTHKRIRPFPCLPCYLAVPGSTVEGTN